MARRRDLERFGRIMGRYELAGAIASWGDVIEFVDGAKPGIVIADTLGHIEAVGDLYRTFLRAQIFDGWGTHGGIDAQMDDLAARIAAKIDAEGTTPAAREEARENYGETAVGYARFDGDTISYAQAGFDFPWIIRDAGAHEKICVYAPRFADRDPSFRIRPGHESFVLGENDVFLLKSDGLVGNIEHAAYRSARDYADVHYIARDGTFWERIPGEFMRPHDVESELAGLIHSNRESPAVQIRDAIIDRFGAYFTPTRDHDDDVTFAVVKRAQR